MSGTDVRVAVKAERDLDAAIERLTRGAERLGPAAERLAASPAPLAIRRVLAAIDGSAASAHVLAWARELALAFHARVDVLHAAPAREARAWAADYMMAMGWVPPPVDLPPQDGEESSRALLEDAVEELERAGVAVEPHLAFGPAVHEIVRGAEDGSADVVIVGSHNRGAAGRVLLGSVADGVKDHVAAHVLIARSAPPPQRLLIGTDGSRASRRAAALGLRLSHAWNAPARVVYVFDPLLAPDPAALRQMRQAAFGPMQSAWTQPRAAFEVDVGVPAQRLLSLAERDAAGLVVLGARGVGGIQSLVAGSVADRVAHEARTSVLLVKEAAR